MASYGNLRISISGLEIDGLLTAGSVKHGYIQSERAKQHMTTGGVNFLEHTANTLGFIEFSIVTNHKDYNTLLVAMLSKTSLPIVLLNDINTTLPIAQLTNAGFTQFDPDEYKDMEAHAVKFRIEGLYLPLVIS